MTGLDDEEARRRLAMGQPVPMPEVPADGDQAMQTQLSRGMTNARAGREVIDARTGMAVGPDGVTLVAGLPPGWDASRAIATGTAQPGVDVGVAPAPGAAAGPPRMVTEGSQTTTTRTKVSDEEKKNLAAQGQLTEEQIANEKKAGAVKVDQARINADMADEQAKLAAAHKIEQETVLKQGQDEYTAAVQRHQKSFDDYSKMGFRDYWSNKTTGDKLMAFFGVMLGGKDATAQINRAIDIDLASQKFEIGKGREAIEQAEKGIGFTRQAGEDRQNAFNLKKAAALDATADKFKALLLRTGIPAEQAESDKRVTTLRQQSLQLQQQVLAETRDRVQTTTTRKLVEGAAGGAHQKEFQAKYGVLAQGMLGELQTIRANPGLSSSVLDKMQRNQLGAESADKSAGEGFFSSLGIAAGRGVGLIPRSKYDGMSPQEQQVANAWDNVIEKYARVLTGAGMPAEEARRLSLQDAPHAGDSPQVIRQKLDRMEGAARHFLSAAGMGAPQAQAPAPQAGGQLTPKDYRAMATWLQSAESRKPENSAKRLRVQQELALLGAR